MKKWNMIVDVALCNDCNNCFMADKDEYVGNDFPPYSVAQPWAGHRWMNIERKERGQFPLVEVAYLPTPCMHCGDAPCMKSSPEGAIYRREDGLVIIDPEKAKGHPEIVDTCPYGAIYWNEEARVAQKCTGCAHLMDDGWKNTRCSQVCPTGALQLVVVDDSEMGKRMEAEGLEAHMATLGTKPRVLYKNLYRWNKAYVAGSVAFADTGDCAEGVAVSAKLDGAAVGKAVTNNFGDFKIDNLEPGEYVLMLSAAGYLPVETVVTVDRGSTSLAPLFLQRA
ncbi:MAG TPA: 4Fe-4S dicluster domain-containing protein [Thermoleophilia bacterium]|nr:4Fe-4S dicluster domain-containing protein [Thermoleophilia bacterium]